MPSDLHRRHDECFPTSRFELCARGKLVARDKDTVRGVFRREERVVRGGRVSSREEREGSQEGEELHRGVGDAGNGVEPKRRLRMRGERNVGRSQSVLVQARDLYR